MTTTFGATGRESIEALLPWHAAGTLSRREADRVDAALARDPDLSRQYALVREELAETIHLNETLGAPSVRAMERLFAGIDAECAAAPRRRGLFQVGLGSWLAGNLSQLNRRTLAWSAGAAALAVLLQGGLLAGLYVSGPSQQTASVREVSYQTASYVRGVDAVGPAASHVLVSFVPQASVADITKFLQAHKLSVVDGPRAGNLYKVRVSAAVSPDDLARIVKRMRDATG